MTVETDTAIWFRYLDLTTRAEALYDFFAKAIEEELVNELGFLAGYDKTKRAIQEITGMPDRLIGFFSKLCLENNRSISARKRNAHFGFLTEAERTAKEQAVKDNCIH